MEAFYFCSAVSCFVLLAVMFRMCGIWKVDMGIVMTVNYAVGIAICSGQADGGLSARGWVLAALTGIIYAIGFILTKRSSEKCGVALTTVTSKASFIIPVLLSWIFIGDSEPVWVVVVMVLTAMVMIYRPGKRRIDWSLPALFVKYGLSYFMLRLMKHLGEGSGAATFAIFISAFAVSAVIFLRGKKENVKKSIGAGILTGAANTGVTYMVLQSLETIPATVFYPMYNAAVIIICTLVSVTAFKERPGRIQWAGVVLAGIAACVNYLV